MNQIDKYQQYEIIKEIGSGSYSSVYKAKKKGVKCVGCPDSGSCPYNSNDSQTKCSGSCSSCSCCGSTEKN